MTRTQETSKEAARRLAARAICDGFEPEALHAYTDGEGAPVYWRIRLKHRETGEKWIRPMKHNGDAYVLGEPAFPDGKILYLRDTLSENPDVPVIVTEGEFKADKLAPLGLVVTTSGGADSAAKADWRPLAGRAVLVWPDNDSAGAGYADAVASILLPLGCTVRILDVAALNLPPKGDAVDWLARHPAATAADVLRLPSRPVTAAPGATVRAPEGRRRAENWIPAPVHPDDSWPDPEPLPSGDISVQAFDLALLPDTLRPWVADICERLQCPADFVAVPVVVALGSLIGRKVGIRPQAMTDWIQYPNVWGCIIGRPGTMKSPAVAEALRPLRRIEARALAEYDARMRDFEGEAELAKLRRDAARATAVKQMRGKNPDAVTVEDLRVDTPDTPILRRYTANDSSHEALGELMRQNPNGLLIERDELASMLSHLSREENASARGFFLTGADAASGYTFDRIGRGLNLRVPVVCLSMLGTTQPGRIASYLRQAIVGGDGDDGLMQRFGLIVWPDHGSEWRNVDRWPDTAARTAACEVFERLEALAPASIGATVEDECAYLRFAPDALEAFTEWRVSLEEKVRSGDLHPALESHLSKYRKTVPALALIFHLADGGSGPATRGAALRALAWSDYLESHARRCYGALKASDNDAARRILARIAAGDLSDGFRARDITQRDWSGLTDGPAVRDALGLMVDFGWLAEAPSAPGAPGRPSVTYRINPKGAAR